MTITHNIRIDLVRPEILPPVPVVQGDTCTREVKISLYAAGEALELPEGHDVAIRYGKPDGTSGIYDTLPDNSTAWASEGNTISVTLCPQMLTCPGKVPTQVSIIVGDRIISTFAFLVLVEADPSKGAMKSENYNNWRKAFIPQTEGAKVGQYLQIAEVDADGRTIAVAAVDDPAADVKTYANTAVDRANAAALSAESAKQAADIALGLAEQANEAVQKVGDAKDIADEAQSTADQALEKVDYLSQNVQRIEDELQDHSDYISAKLNAPAKATVGQFVRVTAVDSSGKITATEAVDAPSGGSDAPEYVRAEAERLAQVVQARQNANTLTFIAASDFHYSTDQQADGLTHMGQAMDVLRDQVQIDFTAALGDMVWDGGESIEQAMQAMRFVSSCLGGGDHQLRTRGNHDCLYSHATGLTNAQIFSNIGAWNSWAEYGNRLAGYCHLDFPDRKIRVICVNSSEHPKGGCLITAEQAAWLETALDLSDKGADWQSIILAHHPLDWGKEGGVNITDTINNAAGLICEVHGHTHNFKVGTITGTSVPRIAIPNACDGRENEYTTAYGVEYGEATTYGKTADTAQDTSFCVVTIDLAAKKIFADHYGAGYSRVVPYDGATVNTYSITNTFSNVTSNNATASVTEGASYTAKLTAASGYELDAVTVTMGGVDITATAYNGGVVSIQSVTGDVVITAAAVEAEEPEEPVIITNLVTTSINSDGTVFNSPYGYQDGVYVSGTASPADANCVATGAILLPNGVNTIYVKGATWDTTNAHVRFYAGDLSSINSHTVKADGSGSHQMDTYFTVTQLGEDYYKWTLTSDGKSYLAGRYYRVSLVGTGANLIITHDQPIE